MSECVCVRYASNTLSQRQGESSRVRECTRFARLDSWCLASPRNRSPWSRFFWESKEGEATRDPSVHSQLLSGCDCVSFCCLWTSIVYGNMAEWTNEFTLNFLEQYHNEPVLWDPTHEQHKDKRKVNDAWLRLSESVKRPVVELKKTKDSLMAMFRGHLRKKKASIRSGALRAHYGLRRN